MKGKISEEQTTNLFAYYQDLGNNKEGKINTKEIESRIRELEEKFEKQKEQSFLFILKREFKEKTAKIIVWIVMSFIGFVLGFLLGFLSK